MMIKSRRSALAMLGLAPAGTALAIENFTSDPDRPGDVRSGPEAYQKERFAKALENLAAAVRADQLMIENMNLSAGLASDSIADRHTLSVTFLYVPSDVPTS